MEVIFNTEKYHREVTISTVLGTPGEVRTRYYSSYGFLSPGYRSVQVTAESATSTSGTFSALGYKLATAREQKSFFRKSCFCGLSKARRSLYGLQRDTTCPGFAEIICAYA